MMWPLIAGHIFEFSATTAAISAKPDREQVHALSVLYQLTKLRFW